MSQGCFGCAKMAANFWGQPGALTKKNLGSTRSVDEKNLAVFVSEVETLLLRKNIRYKNSVSVAL